MNIYEELNNVVSCALSESISKDRVKELAIEQIKEWQAELLENLQGDWDLIDELAEINDYRVHDSALVIKVKNMPYIKEPLLSKITDKFGEDTVGQIIVDEIQVFAADMQSTFGENFVILGRSGGYWGIDGVNRELQITKEGYDKLADKLIEEANNPERDYKEVLEQAIKDEDENEIINVFYTLLQYDLSDFADDLANIENGIEIKPSFLEKLRDLKTRIEEKEEEMNTEEFWSKYNG